MNRLKKGCIIVIAAVMAAAIMLFVMLSLFITGFAWAFTIADMKYHASIDETHDIEMFRSEAYLKYNGGPDAKKFFDEYAIFKDYKDAGFHYKDGDKMISTLNHCTAFVLDIYYEEMPDEILESYNLNLDFHHYQRPFSIYKIDSEKDIYTKNSAFVMMDPQHKTVRYVFICKYSSIDSNDVKENLKHVLPELNWNVNEEDWMFNYSDLK